MMNLSNQEVIDTAQVVVPLMTDFVIPKIETLIKGNKAKKVYKDAIETTFENYLERSYELNSIMNTLALKDQQMKIDDLYIPLSVNYSSYEDGIRYEGVIKINCYDNRLLPKYKKVLLVDNAGTGKSTIEKYLFLKAIEENKGIPVFIELRKLSKDGAIIDYIINEINGIDEYLDKEDIYKMINDGDFIFFFDGYDEINSEYIKEVNNELVEFISKANKNYFMLSSRDEKGLNSFGNFQRFNVIPLKKEEAFNLLRKYDIDSNISEILIEELNKKENFDVIHDFLENPLMVSLLFMTYKNKNIIPEKKNIFYKNVYESLFEDHDLSKSGRFVHEKKSKLDIDDFEKFLRILSFKTFKEGVLYSSDKFEYILSEVKFLGFSGYDFSIRDIIYDLLNVVPLFIKEGGEYRWIHKSFQEYFLARYIYVSGNKKEKLLKEISDEDKIDKLFNVLDFYYDIDVEDFEKYILLPLLEDIVYKNRNYFTNEYFNDYDKTEINLRKNFIVLYEDIIIVVPDKESLFSEEDSLDTYKKKVITYVYNIIGGENSSEYSETLINSDIVIRYKVNKNAKFIKRLLYHKASNLVMEYNSKSILPVEELIIPSGNYFIDDSIDNKVNSLELFKIINSCMIRSFDWRMSKKGTSLVRFGFDFEKCKCKLDEINNKTDCQTDGESIL